MKLQARLQHGAVAFEHEVELLPPDAADGVRRLRIGSVTVEAQCVEINPGAYSLLIQGKPYEVLVTSRPGGDNRKVMVGAQEYLIELRDPRRWRRAASLLDNEGPQEIVAPMPGKIVKILISEGEEVAHGQGLLVIEAMKMQNELRAPRAGRVERVYVAEGRGVETATRLVRLA